MTELEEILKNKGISFLINKPIASLSSMKVGGVAEMVIQAKTEEQLVFAVRACRAEGISYEVVGGMTNTIFSDRPFMGAVIMTLDDQITIDAAGTVYLGAGVTTAVAAQKISEAGFTGFEWAVGIPGKIGGAIVGNAGAMKGEIKDSCVSVRVYDVSLDVVKDLPVQECQFSYRESLFKSHRTLIVLGGQFQFEQGDVVKSREIMKETLVHRMKTQPKGEVSCGCMFKNYALTGDEDLELLKAYNIPEAMLAKGLIGAGWLIEQSGGKGLQSGGACVSTVHGNFLTNIDHATVEDLRTLVEQVKALVFTTFGIHLEEEVRYI